MVYPSTVAAVVPTCTGTTRGEGFCAVLGPGLRQGRPSRRGAARGRQRSPSGFWRTSPETTHANHSRLGHDVETVEAVGEGRTHGAQAVVRGGASRPAGAACRSHRRVELARRTRVRRGITNTAIRKEEGEAYG